MTTQFSLPEWYDLHTHLRQDDLLAVTLAGHLAAHCVGLLAMPNTKPPVARVLETQVGFGWSIESYLQKIAQQGGDQFDAMIVPLYLTQQTTAEMIEQGAASGLLRACKYYPPHATTNSEYGCDIDQLIKKGVFAEMARHDVVLCIHGEQHDLPGKEYFARQHNAEEIFYRETMPKLRDQYPSLRIVCEHLTTQVAVNFVQQSDATVAATITPQHLLYTIGDLLQGLKYHLYCLPLLKFEQDRQALCDAVTAPHNQQFFAGTDSAPHTQKMTECGCAAGCYTAPIGPQLYAQAFEMAGIDLSIEAGQAVFKRFLCELGPRFYRLPISTESFTLVKAPQTLHSTKTSAGQLLPLPLGLGLSRLEWSIL